MNLTTTKGFRVLLAAFMVILSIGSSSALAQRDLIRTQAGEEIRCRIIDETPVRFVFAYLKEDKLYRSEIFKNLVTSFKYDFYTEDLPFVELLPKSISRRSEELSTQTTRSLSQNSSNKVRKNRNHKKEIYSNDGSIDTTEIAKGSIDQQKAFEEEINTKNGTAAKSQQNNESLSRSVTRHETDDSNKKAELNLSLQEEKQDFTRKTTQLNNENETTTKKRIEAGSDDKVAIDDAELPKITINQANRFRIGVKAGIGNRVDNSLQTTNTYDLYLEQLLRGYVFGADLGYFPIDAVGFGFTYTDFRSRNSDENIVYHNVLSGNEATGSIGNRRSVKFIGPTLFLRKKLDYKTYIVLGLSPGYNLYTDNGNYDGLNYTFAGKGFGAASTLGIDFLLGNDIIGRDIILSFEAGYNYGKINALDYGDSRGAITLNNPLIINRLDFAVGLRFIRFPKYFRLTSY